MRGSGAFPVTPLAGLALAATAFVGTHFAMSHPLCPAMVARLGERFCHPLLARQPGCIRVDGVRLFEGSRRRGLSLERGRCGVGRRQPVDVGRLDPVRRVASPQSGLSCARPAGRADRSRDRRIRDHAPSDDVGLRGLVGHPCAGRPDDREPGPVVGDRVPRAWWCRGPEGPGHARFKSSIPTAMKTAGNN